MAHTYSADEFPVLVRTSADNFVLLVLPTIPPDKAAAMAKHWKERLGESANLVVLGCSTFIDLVE